ncbi:hypothetical protein DEDE109153_01855 [Deinococcus deserti]|uniref:Uncharacterized protein n=1 Tax=Deinococcus deserti (strain DSM 17065 / CIP 109153 / LMG 22923 / VCD115) TaxID=546414 RepID=C1CV75_DEIDV|nr:hypothetical protein [Deinococcus deserti]ACO46092.1 hypothetical protein Deide_11830 [Deinococcus deserti VCD115]
MDWKAILADLRAHLPPGEGSGPVRGSLRWLEAEMRERGANPASLRNIVYRDIGTPRDKAALASILNDLAKLAGRPELGPHSAPVAAPLPDELELLGRSKKRAFKQFVSGVRAGRAPRLIVSGRAGAGKTILLSQVERALLELQVPVRRLALAGEAGPVLGLPHLVGQSFAALGQAQTDAARAALPDHGALLVRVTRELSFAGGPPRDPLGRTVTPARWAQEQLLRRAPDGVAVLLAVEDPEGLDEQGTELIELRPPSPAEARTYLMGRLGVTRAEADRLVAETGRHLDRLALLGSLGSDTGEWAPGGIADLMADRDARALAEATAALQTLLPPGHPIPGPVLEAALGSDVSSLPAHARALVRGADGGWLPSAALQAAWPQVSPAARLAALRHVAGAEGTVDSGLRMSALAAVGDWAALATLVTRHPDDARHLPPLWPAIRQSAQGTQLETLARAVVGHHAGRGEYGHPRLRDGLFTLLESDRDVVRAWARVKLAESSLEAGNIEAAHLQLAHADVAAVLEPVTSLEPWARAAQADALLVEAALARWQGDLETATRKASDPRAEHGGPRALLWRGLIAKDAGRWPEALTALRAVPLSSPLLSGRARYQEGDLMLRLGLPGAGLRALDDAASRLEVAGGTAEELARVLARSGTALRRLGRAREGLERLGRALALLPQDLPRYGDAVPRARLLSEAAPAHLALGQPEEALRVAGEALALLSRSDGRRAEAGYRQRRTLLRVALAYLTRGLGRCYLQPLSGATCDSPDLAHARQLMDQLLLHGADASDRDLILRLDLHLSRALAEPDAQRAMQDASAGLSLARHPYEEAQARAVHADAQWRAGQPDQALAEINRAYALLRRVPGAVQDSSFPASISEVDPGLQAQLLTLEARIAVMDGTRTLLWLRDALQADGLAPFRTGVWREVGLTLETAHPGARDVVLTLHPAADLQVLRLSDALVQAEESLCGSRPRVGPS